MHDDERSDASSRVPGAPVANSMEPIGAVVGSGGQEKGQDFHK